MEPLFLVILATMLAAAHSPSGPQSAEAPQPTADPVRFEITHVESAQPQIIRIFNLDEGTREIKITHVEVTHPQSIRILNADDDTLDITLPPTP